MVDANMSFGVLRKAWLDVEKNWITMNYFSDGYLRLEGYLPSANMMDRNIIKVLYRPVGIVFFHSPSEHTFNGNSYDVEMQVLFTDKYYNLAMVSVFFDQAQGGVIRNDFIDSLGLGAPGVGGVADNDQLQSLFDGLELTDVFTYDGSLTMPPCW